jgi:predicted AlkP superfamily pyrophosphatase or phosphodiesterase
VQVARLASPIVFAVACAGTPAPPPSIPTAAIPKQPSGPVKHVILVSIDGMPPEAYVHPDAHGLAVPTLRRIVREGASSEGALSVFPTVTYPAHASIATGVVPGKHGIVTNRTFDPLGQDLDGWRWYAEDITREPIWKTVERAGFTAATIWWPVTVGAHVTWHVPEVWRAKNEGDKKLVRALSTPGLLDAVVKEHPDFWSRFMPPETTDDSVMDIALHVLETGKPTLMLVHMAQVDDKSHDHGLWSKEVTAAIEHADAQLGRLLDALKRTGLDADTTVVVVSDHGFVNVTAAVKPCVLLRDAGFLTVDNARVTAWKAVAASSGGSAYLYLHDPADVATRDAVRALITTKAKDPASGIAHVYSPEEIKELGGDPAAMLAIEAVMGTHMVKSCSGPYADKATDAAVHGYDPRRPELHAAMLFFGKNVPHGSIPDARLIDVAPTIASWLGLSMPDVDGKPLAVRPSN